MGYEMRKNVKEIVMKKGNGHRFFGKHSWDKIDRKELESLYGVESIEILDSWYARYRTLYRCKCGEEVMTEEIAFI